MSLCNPLLTLGGALLICISLSKWSKSNGTSYFVIIYFWIWRKENTALLWWYIAGLSSGPHPYWITIRVAICCTPKIEKNKQIIPMMLKIKFYRFFSFIINSTLKYHRSIMHFMKQPLVPALFLQKKENFLPQKEVSFGLQYMNQSKIQASFQGMILILNSHS